MVEDGAAAMGVANSAPIVGAVDVEVRSAALMVEDAVEAGSDTSGVVPWPSPLQPLAREEEAAAPMVGIDAVECRSDTSGVAPWPSRSTTLTLQPLAREGKAHACECALT